VEESKRTKIYSQTSDRPLILLVRIQWANSGPTFPGEIKTDGGGLYLTQSRSLITSLLFPVFTFTIVLIYCFPPSLSHHPCMNILNRSAPESRTYLPPMRVVPRAQQLSLVALALQNPYGELRERHLRCYHQRRLCAPSSLHPGLYFPAQARGMYRSKKRVEDCAKANLNDSNKFSPHIRLHFSQ